jgi:ribosomal protein S18 acetylase RimI-like enzyme
MPGEAQPDAGRDAAGPVVIRRAVAADAEAIHAMIRALGALLGLAQKVTGTVEDIRRHGFGPSPAFEALIAECGGRPVGLCLFFASFSSWRAAPGLYVQDLYVADAARGTGLGRRLLAAAAAIGRARGATYLRLSVEADNVAAQRFYARAGLAWSTTERIFVIDGAAFEALGRAGTQDGD